MALDDKTVKIVLDERDLPTHWYNKPNTAVAQSYYNKQEGTKRLTTESGAGQWVTPLSLACSMFDLECTVYMVKAM